jgi:predicted ATPase
MITRIEIDGFKTFKDFKVELAPFQVIVGPNGSGKSNLFDALHLLSRLATDDLAHAFQELRGDPDELFTKLPERKTITIDRIKIAVEMLLDSKVRDQLGKEGQLKYRRLRYEIEIVQGPDVYGLERLYVRHEALKSIPLNMDEWYKKYRPSPKKNFQSSFTDDQTTFIETKPTPIAVIESILDKSESTVEQDMIYLYPDNEDEQTMTNRFYTSEVQRTVLSTITNAAYPHAFATHEELLSLRILHLNPEALRQPGLTKGPRYLSHDGGNLPTTLARMQAEDKYALIDVSRDMANLVRGIFKIRVDLDRASDKYIIYVDTSDQQTFSAQVLSDGTLRLLALATLRNDLRFHGILCLEEPEDGVEPLHLKVMARMLREMATDFNDPEQAEEPLRQVLVTSHSPAFISLGEVLDSLLFTHLVTLGGSDQDSLPVRITRMEPVVTPNTQSRHQPGREGEQSTEIYTIDMVRQYLSNEDLNHARNQLKKARIHSIERKSNAS